MSGVVDPETLYTKQNCIGTLQFIPSVMDRADEAQVVGALEKCSKGMDRWRAYKSSHTDIT